MITETKRDHAIGFPAFQAPGHHLILIDMYTAFTQDPNYKNTLFADGLHPNDAGYALMGQTWYAAISEYLR